MRLGRIFVIFLSLWAHPALAEWAAPSATEMAAMETLEPQQRWDQPQWLKDRELIKTTVADCQQSWDIVWRWAKTGNLQARSFLLASEAYPGLGFEKMPLTPEEPSQRVWSRLFLAIYQLGYRDDSQDFMNFERMSLDHIDTWKAKGVPKFSACYHKNPSPVCTAIAIEEGLIPSFDVFAAQIDQKIAAGAKPVCSDRNYL